MERFHIITLLVATVTLIILLTISGILLHNDKRSQKFPPTHKKCPDGWTHEGNDPGTCTFVDGGANQGTDDTDDTDDTVYTLKADPCENKEWADKNGIYWDGLTTYNGC